MAGGTANASFTGLARAAVFLSMAVVAAGQGASVRLGSLRKKPHPELSIFSLEISLKATLSLSLSRLFSRVHRPRNSLSEVADVPLLLLSPVVRGVCTSCERTRVRRRALEICFGRPLASGIDVTRHS